MNGERDIQPHGVERFRSLYAMMVGVPAEKVDMFGWRRASTDEALIHSCGTAACAVGWACAYPEFQAQGLRFMGASFQPVYGGHQHWGAVQAFFGVSGSTALWLFDTWELGLGAKKGVLGRIRTLLHENRVISDERNAELAAMEQGLKA